MTNHAFYERINLADIIDVDASGRHGWRGEYVVVLASPDGDHEVPLAEFHDASAAAVYCANLRSIVRQWLVIAGDEAVREAT